MGWTYTGDPSAAPLDAVRFAVGDTTEADPLLQDGEITYLLEQAGGSVLVAAVAACEAIAAKFSRDVDKSSSVTSVSASQRRDHYVAQAALLRGRLARRPQFRFADTDPARFSRLDDKNGRP